MEEQHFLSGWRFQPCTHRVKLGCSFRWCWRQVYLQDHPNSEHFIKSSSRKLQCETLCGLLPFTFSDIMLMERYSKSKSTAQQIRGIGQRTGYDRLRMIQAKGLYHKERAFIGPPVVALFFDQGFFLAKPQFTFSTLNMSSLLCHYAPLM